MKRTSLIPQRLVSPALIMASVVIAVGTPAATANAQFSLGGSGSLQSALSLDQYKQKITTAIESSVEKLQTSANNLNFNIDVQASQNGITVNGSGPAGSVSGTVNKDGATGQISGQNGSSASGTVNKDGATGSVNDGKGTTASGSIDANGATSQSSGPNGSSSFKIDYTNLASNLNVPKELIKKLQDSNKKAIDKLNDLKAEVAATGNLQDLQAKAKEFDQEFKEIAAANVQAAVTKSIDSMTRVLARLQSASDGIQAQLNLLKECIQKGSANVSGSANGSGANGTASVSAPTCADLNVDINSGDEGTSLQEKLNEVKSSLETIKSFLSSSISLVAQLKDGNFTGTIKSFQGISSQVDIVASLSSDVQNDLLNLSAAINKS